MRYLTSLTIPSEGVLRIPANTATTAFQDSRFIIDGDLAIDRAGTVGIIGSSVDNSGDYTVTKVGALNVDWDNVLNKPELVLKSEFDDFKSKADQKHTQLQQAIDGKADKAHVHENATVTKAGFMSAEDKAKLDSLEVATVVETKTYIGIGA